MKASRAQILGVLIAMISVSMFAYVNFIAPRMKVKSGVEVKTTPVDLASTVRYSIHAGEPKRLPSDKEVNQGVEIIKNLYGVNNVEFNGEPIIISFQDPEVEEMVLTYEITKDGVSHRFVEVFELSSNPFTSIFHVEGEDLQYYPVSVKEAEGEKKYLLVADRTGATGKYLNLTFLEYDGFGKVKEAFRMNDLTTSLFYPIRKKLLLDQDNRYYEIVREQDTVRLVDYDIKGRLGLHILSYSFQNGAWDVQHNQESISSSGANGKLSLTKGDEVFLIRATEDSEFSVRTLIDGPGLEYVKGPPVHIMASKVGEGSIYFVSDSDKIPEYKVSVEIIPAK